MLREIPGVIVYIVFLAGFVFLMNTISATNFNGDANYFSLIGAGVIIFITLMVYWERIFPAGD
jgi:ABC-type nickel/cobalt efflux system permease component RcnA